MIAAALALLAVPVGVAAQDDELVWSTEGTIELEFVVTGDRAVAETSVVLVNRGTVGSSIALSLIGAPEGLALEPTTETIDPGSAVAVDIVISGPIALAASKVSGSILASVTDSSPANPTSAAVVSFTITAPSSTVSDAVLIPSAVSITANRCYPGFIPLPIDCWSFVGTPPQAKIRLNDSIDPSGLPVSWSIFNESGGTLRIALQPSEDAGLEIDEIVVRLGESSANGKFAGSVPLDPGAEKSPEVAVIVHVQDLFLWPLLAIAIGAAFAFFLADRADRQRPKELLRARIKSIAADVGPRPEGGYPITAIAVEPAWACPALASASRAERLYCQIATVRSREELEDLAKEVADFELTVAEWKKASASHKKLAELIRQYSRPLSDDGRPDGAPLPSDAPMLVASAMVRDRQIPFETGVASSALATEVADQLVALREWIDSWILTTASGKLYDALEGMELPASERLLVREHHPDNLIHGYVWPATDLRHMQRHGVVERARETFGLLKGLASSHGAGGVMNVDADVVAALATSLAGESDVQDLAQDNRPAPVILAEVAEADGRQYVYVFAVTVIVYFATIYGDKDFGSLWQYLIALTAGVFGALAVKWDLLPWYRSYKPAMPKA